jgi:ATP-binding cassette subfamily C protein LapB
MKTVLALLEAVARRQHVELSPGWQSPVQSVMAESGDVDDQNPDALARVCSLLGWPKPYELARAPRPEQFPLVAYRASTGWALAEQWLHDDLVRVITPVGVENWQVGEEATRFFNVSPPGIRGKKLPSKALPIFVKAVLGRRRMIIEGAVSTAVLSLIGLASSLFSMQVYDRVIPQGGLSTLWVLLMGVLIAVGIDFVLRLIRAMSLENEAAIIDAEISSLFFARMQAVRLDARPPSIGSLAAQMRGLEQVRAIMSSASLLVLADLPFAFFLIWVVWQLGGVVGVVPLVAFPLSVLMAFLVSGRIRENTKLVQIGANRKNGQLVEALDAAETIKATRGHWELLARWNQLTADVHVQDHRVRRWSAVSNSAVGAVSQLTYIAMITVGSLEVIQGHMTMGALIACSIISGRITGPLIATLPSLIVQWNFARAALDGLDQILNMPVDREPDGEFLRPDSLKGVLKVDGVRFGYPAARTGLEVPALQIGPGERVAIIGPVGSGKSTLLKILAGLYRPQAGTVLLAGLDIHQIADDVLRREVGYLPQDYRLINGTLRDNLLLGRSDPGDEALMAAAAAVGLDQMIAAHPKGLQLAIAEGGTGLSGGQRQLAGLTRLLLGNPRLLLLDEPTAALDQDSENRVMAALDRAAGTEGTVVMVTHKLSLLTHVQRVILVIGGRVVLDGPTRAVLERLQAPAPAAAPPAVTATAGGAA